MGNKKRYRKHAEKREGGGFVPLPHAVLRSAEFAALSARATKLLCDLLAQYRGDNNGDLCAAFSVLRPRGWQGAATVARALAELQAADFIVRTRAGGRHKAALYAVTFYEMDFCAGKLDLKAPSRAFMGAWRRNGAPPVDQLPADCSTSGLIQPESAPIAPQVEQSSPISQPD